MNLHMKSQILAAIRKWVGLYIRRDAMGLSNALSYRFILIRESWANNLQAWLPVHQIYQGNCGGPEIEKVLGDYYRMNLGSDNLGYHGSPDEARWNDWHNLQSAEDALKKAS